jgi:hypothetical protein
MAKIEFDFRDGIDGNKKVYYDKRWFKWKEFLAYIFLMLLTWALSAACFSLFLTGWLRDRWAALWTFVGVWFGFLAIMLGFFIIPNTIKHYKEEEERERELHVSDKEKEFEENENKEKNNEVKPEDVVLENKKEEVKDKKEEEEVKDHAKVDDINNQA